MWLALIYLLLSQPVLSSSRFILNDLLLFDGNSSKHIVSLHEECSTAWDLFLSFEDEELTILNGHTTSNIVKRTWRKIGSSGRFWIFEESDPRDVDRVYKSDCFAIFSLRTWLSIQEGTNVVTSTEAGWLVPPDLFSHYELLYVLCHHQHL